MKTFFNMLANEFIKYIKLGKSVLLFIFYGKLTVCI